jgi:hypothetical protein
MNLTPSLAHFVWLGHPLSGGNPSGPAKPVPRGSWHLAAPVSCVAEDAMDH